MRNLIAPLSVACILLAAIIAVVYWVVSYNCRQLGELSGNPTRLVGLTCYVQTAEDRWIPQENWQTEGH